ncbi:MAG TPA: hypothetical protein VMI06_14125 [Terriglobia bacterium]|nr:hypothetical protein [Terriglobia bacterium]
MDGNFFRRWVCRVRISSLILASVLMAASGSVFPAGQPGGQFPQRAQSPSNLPGAIPPTPGEPSVLSRSVSPAISTGPPLNHRQKDALVRDNFKKTRDDVAKLSKLVRSLQQAINRSNANILSVSIVKQANRIEKLAKRIKAETKGY